MKPPPHTIVWDDRLATGIADVDTQHQHLFQITNRLGRLHAEGATLEQMSELLVELQQYTIDHFNTEESLMQRYPVSEAHRHSHLKAHQGFIRHVQRARSLAEADPNTAVDVMLAFLAQWLLHHVANMDRHLGEEIKRLHEGGTATYWTDRQAEYDASLVENVNDVYRDLAEKTFQILELNLKLRSEIERRNQIEAELNESKSRFRTMADHTHSWEYWQGTNGEIIYMSPSCKRITGYTPDEFAENPDNLYQIIHHDDRHLMEAHRHDLNVEEAGEDELGFRIVHRDGSVKWIMHVCKALHDTDGKFLGRRSSNRDITDRQTKNDSLMLIANVLDSVNEAVLVTNAENRVIVVNSSFSDITGYTPEDLIGKDPGVLADEMPPPDLVQEQWQSLTKSGRWRGEMINRRKNGELYSAQVSIEAVRDEYGDVSNFVLVFSDMTESKANESRIKHLAHHDQLTGLANWRLFSDRMNSAVDAAMLNSSHLALMFVDIDRFKQAKDKLGQDACDDLLKEFAARLRNCLRRADTAARIGSDEFLVLLTNIESERDATTIASAILDAVAQPFTIGEHQVQISASIGLAIYPEHGDSAEILMKNADLAMYQTKQDGGSTIRIYSPADWRH